MKKVLLLILMIPLFISAQNRPRVSVLGDSYSTFQGYIPEGNETWYYTPADTSRTDVDNVTQTWWWQVINQAGCLIEKIDSYSGATVSYHGYDNLDYSARSFITRLPRLGSPDVIFIFGGTNDDWAGAELGDYKYDNFTRVDSTPIVPHWLTCYSRQRRDIPMSRFSVLSMTRFQRIL